eukprot:IDg12543t1
MQRRRLIESWTWTGCVVRWLDDVGRFTLSWHHCEVVNGNTNRSANMTWLSDLHQGAISLHGPVKHNANFHGLQGMRFVMCCDGHVAMTTLRCIRIYLCVLLLPSAARLKEDTPSRYAASRCVASQCTRNEHTEE